MALTKLNSASVIDRLPTGSVLQTIQSHKSDTFTTTSTSYTDITGLSVAITPISTSSKILVTVKVSGALWSEGHTYLQIVRGSTAIGNADSAGNRPVCFSSVGMDAFWKTADHVHQYLDSPNTTNATTYKIQCRGEYGTLYINRSHRDENATDSDQRTSSVITVQEIKG